MNQWRLWRSDNPSHLDLDNEKNFLRSAEAEWNMRCDAAMLEGVAANALPPTLRLYQWRRPAITVGRFQNVERTIETEFCQQQDIPIVRRVTGGRGILHGTDLTIALAAPISHLLPQGYEAKGVSQVYAVISETFLKAFAECGIVAEQGREACNRSATGNCFASNSRADVVAANGTQKLLGAALHRSGDFILMQASVPRSGDETLLNDVFTGKTSFRALATDFSLEQLEAAITRNFAENFAITYLISEPIDRN